MSGLVRSLGTLLVLLAVLTGAPAARGGPVAPRPTATPPLFPPAPTAPATPAPVPSAATATATGTPGPCPPAWRIAAGPRPSWSDNVLRALAVVSADDVWAVGSAAGRALTAHWDGSVWSLVPVSNFGLIGVSLSGAAAVGPNDVWAVGAGTTASGEGQTLMLHWDGSAWRRVPSPHSETDSVSLSSVTAVAPDDVWAAGETYKIGGITTNPILILHWNGREWSRVATPAIVPGHLRALDAVAADDVWAVGVVGEEPLILHWNGTTWSRVFMPRPSIGHSSLSSVAAIAADDVWAVGYYSDSMNYAMWPLIEHWDGTRWSPVAVLSASYPANGGLSGVAAMAAKDVWAVGMGSGGTLTLHWDGNAWRRVPSPNTANGLYANHLGAVAAVRAGDIWAIGGFMAYSAREQPFVLHYGETCGDPAPLPDGCALPFRDVDRGHPFASNIQCLYCQGVVDGYSDGTFRPDAHLTRGQATKLLFNALTAQWSMSADQQTFSDVPPGHPFWLFIEAAYIRREISGYSDGTFRPGNDMTRGQMAKFVSNVRHYADTIPPAQQSFSDVPPADPFWLFIERAHLHGVIGGYSDGTFRPGASVTRGQASKFISNAFFPGCGPLR